MGGQRTITFGHSEQLDGRNWLLMAAASIVLAISKIMHKKSYEQQDGQNEPWAK